MAAMTQMSHWVVVRPAVFWGTREVYPTRPPLARTEETTGSCRGGPTWPPWAGGSAGADPEGGQTETENFPHPRAATQGAYGILRTAPTTRQSCLDSLLGLLLVVWIVFVLFHLF